MNGGQTTASLYNAQKRDKADLSKIFVQMKLSIIDPEIINDIVPNISKFANTQNKVSDSDFFANHEFHRRIEEQSRRIWAPRKDGVLKQSKWFYERSRGQYLEEQANLSDSKKKEFGEIYPKIQMFTKIDLGKIFVVFDMYPNHAVKGAQSAFKYFADKIVDKWESGDDQYNDLFYKHAVAKIIIFKACQKIISSDESFRGQDRAILVAYTIFALLVLIDKKDLSIDYFNIWEKQDINEAFSNQLKLVSVVLNRFMHEQTEKIGVTILSYSKTESCIKNLKENLENKEFIILGDDFIDVLIDKNESKSDIRTAKIEQRTDNGIIAQTKVMNIPSIKWKSIMDQARKKGIVTPKELGILAIATQIPNKIPSEKQSLILVDILEKVLEEGIVAA